MVPAKSPSYHALTRGVRCDPVASENRCPAQSLSKTFRQSPLQLAFGSRQSDLRSLRQSFHDRSRPQRTSDGRRRGGFFPAGTSCLFRVDDHFGKVAVLGETMTARRRTQTLEKTRPVGIPVFGCSSHRKDSHGRCAFDSDPHQAVFDFPPPALGYPPTSRRELKPS